VCVSASITSGFIQWVGAAAGATVFVVGVQSKQAIHTISCNKYQVD
jgi:hypothetical protein